MSKIDVDQTVRDLEAGKTPEWITEHLRIYRDSGGAEGHLFDSSVGGGLGLVPSLLLTTVGQRSGEKRTSPLFYGTAGEAYVVVTNGASLYLRKINDLALGAISRYSRNSKKLCKKRFFSSPSVSVNP